MLKNIRRKAANAINPEKSQEYPFMEFKITPAEESNKNYLKTVRKRFSEEVGREPVNDQEAWEHDKKMIDKLMEQINK